MWKPARRGARGGYTLIEVLICSTLFTIIFLASISLIEHDRSLSRSMLHMSHVELMSQEMLFDIEREVANAYGSSPVAIAPFGLAAGALELRVDSTLGFPPVGQLVLDRGTASEEIVAYSSLTADKENFVGLARGLDCTQDVDHAVQVELLWEGLAQPVQPLPPGDTADYDGIALEDSGPVYFRGRGTGFSYRVPVDPAGGESYLVGDEITWGATVPGAGPTLDGWNAIYYRPRLSFDESEFGDDVNLDGDTADVFDVGQLRRVTWDVTNPGQKPGDHGLGPTNVLQERCNHGGDLDHDGFDDPLFLWDAKNHVLHMRLFLIGLSDADAPVTRKVESVMFLRNEPEMEM